MANLKDMAESRTAILWFKPEQLAIKPGLNGRDFTSPENMEHVEQIAASIAENGFLQSKPLEIFSEGETIYVSDGESRFRAVELLKSRGVIVEKIPCVSEGRGTNDADRILNQTLHNSGKRLTPLEEGRNMKRALALGKTVADIAKKLGRSVTFVNQAIDFQAAPAEVHALVVSGAISTTLAAKTIRQQGAAAGTETIKAAVGTAKAAGKAKATEKQIKPLAKPARAKKAPSTFEAPSEADMRAAIAPEAPSGEPLTSRVTLEGALEKALSAVEYLMDVINASDPETFKNGVTDSTGSIDEGDVIASRALDAGRVAVLLGRSALANSSALH